MKKVISGILIAAVFLLVVGGLIYFITPQRTDFSIHLTGARMTPDGRIFDTGDIILEGEIRQSGDSGGVFYPSRISVFDILDLEFSASNDSGVFSFLFNPSSNCQEIYGLFYDPDTSDTNSLCIFYNAGKDICALQLGWGRYKSYVFVGTAQENDDYAAVLNADFSFLVPDES